ncbi:S49 family peptidase [Roseobacter sp. CCS2]|uniref:S49 family peptidase n=1 Tax=Roseobacter sp. CCS2 TaxID=391593 RepID=UPI0000F3C79B|nr:S49 family peptidase [Roseobacter sp. CCS2]EBA11786.1 Periplasmic serine protease (ClpP class) [Roseobacter sp. CCS2]
MTTQTIASLMGGAALALCSEFATGLMAMEVTAEQLTGEGAITIESGERFAIQRGVAVVPVRGLLTPNSYGLERWLGWTTYHGLADTMGQLAASEEVAAIVLEIDTPGGMVLAIEAAGEAIAATAAVKPVHAVVCPMATSAGYWLASQCTDISMTPGAWIGSIGVQMSTYSPVQPGMHGDQWFNFRSQYARAKNPDAATEPGTALIDQRLNALEADFHAAIAAGRGIAPADLPARLSVTDDVADGGAVFGFQEARARGLADAQMTRDVFFADIFDKYAPKPNRTASRAYHAKAAAARARVRT